MRKFKTEQELKNDPELRDMCRYCWERVELEGKEVFACTTNQQYEDIIWGGALEMLNQLCEHFRIADEINTNDLATDVRDFVLEKLEEQGVKFVDVFDEY